MRASGLKSTAPHGHRRLLARLACLAVAALAVGLFVFGLPVYFGELHTVCAGKHCFSSDQLSPTGVREFRTLGLSTFFYAAYFTALVVLTAAVYCALAVVIFLRRPNDRIALFVSLFLVVWGTAFSDAFDMLRTIHPGLWTPVQFVEVIGNSSFFLLFFLFPDGHFVPRLSSVLAALVIASQVVVYFFPDSPLNPNGWSTFSELAFYFPLIGICVSAQVYRYRRASNPSQRQQTKWVVFGFALAMAGFVGLISLGAIFPSLEQPGSLASLITNTGTYLIALTIPVSLGIAILRHRLWDIDVIINRALVYGALTACVVGIYVLVVGYLGALFRTGGNLAISLVATGVVAVLFQPLRDRFQRGVNHLMYGERDDPYAVLSRLGQRLEATLGPRAALPAVAETVAQALKLPYAAVALEYSGESDEFVVAASWGTLVDTPIRLPLVYQHEIVGELLLAPRVGEKGFSPDDRRLLDDLARQAGVAAHAVRLTADLQRARERLVSAREEERRRLRRDLHDGLGPQLSSQMLTIDAVRALMRQDPDDAEKLLLDLKAQSQDAITDIRRLVYALRPPALDDLGLLGAIRETAAQYGQNGLRVAVEAPETLPPLPAAVEVAAYRIAQEALTNVVRHAEARTCAVLLDIDGEAGALCLEIQDDGRGIGENRGTGIGLASMRERVAELGGSLTVESLPERGTIVRARLPLSEEG